MQPLIKKLFIEVIEQAVARSATKLFWKDTHHEAKSAWINRTAMAVGQALVRHDSNTTTLDVDYFMEGILSGAYINSISMAGVPTFANPTRGINDDDIIQPEIINHASTILAIHCNILDQLRLLPNDVWSALSFAIKDKISLAKIAMPDAYEAGTVQFIRIDQEDIAKAHSERPLSGVSIPRIAYVASVVTRIVCEEGVLLRYDLPELGCGDHAFTAQFVACTSPLATIIKFINKLLYAGIALPLPRLKVAIVSGDESSFAVTPDILSAKKLNTLAHAVFHKYSGVVTRSVGRYAAPGLYNDNSLADVQLGGSHQPMSYDRQGFMIAGFEGMPGPSDIDEAHNHHLGESVSAPNNVGVYFNEQGSFSGFWYGSMPRMALHCMSDAVVVISYAHNRLVTTASAITFRLAPVPLRDLCSNPDIVADVQRLDW